MNHFEARIWVPASIDDVWTFFSNPRNLTQLTPPFMRAEIESEAVLHNDSTVVVTLKPWVYPMGIKWVSKIHEVEATGPSRRFVDHQASGPFAHWKHTHLFFSGVSEAKSAEGKSIQGGHGGTWIVDKIDYELPFGFAGKVADRFFSRHQIVSSFNFRYKEVRKVFRVE